MKVVIVGGGGSALTAASIIKQANPKARIDIFTLRREAAYPPCEMPFAIGGEIKINSMFMHSKDELMKMFNFHFSTRVKSIDVSKKKVFADKAYDYDKLILATGARPFIPFSLSNDNNVFSLSTDLSDARRIMKASKNARSIAIIGAGPIGLELAQSFSRLGKKVSVLEYFDRVLPKLVDKDFSSYAESVLKNNKIAFYPSARIKDIKGDKRKEIVFNNKVLRVDMVVFATGFRANTSLAREAGIKVNKGVIVDKFMRTSVKDVYAIGDVIETWDSYFKRRMTVMVANNAISSAKVAALDILGLKTFYKGSTLPFSITLFGSLLQSVGWSESSLNDMGVPFKKVVHEGVTRKPELGGGRVFIKLLYDPKKLNLLGAQIFSEDPEFQELNRLIVIASKKIPLPEASFFETSYTPTIDMPANALSIAMSKAR